jgi:hypothetical protein
MPTVTKYSYTLPADIPQGVAVGNLQNEINAPDSGVTIQVDHIDASPTTLDIYMKDVLAAGEKTALDGDTTAPAGGLLAAHDPTPLDEPQHVTIDDGPKGPMGENRVYDPPNRPGFYANNRDIRLRTAKITNSFTDNGQNLTTFKQDPWDEITMVAVKKLDGNGDYVDCTDDGDAAINAVLSIWDLHCHDHSDPNPANCNIIPIDLLGGRMCVDKILEAPYAEHVFYAVAMPEIPAAMGGKIPFFDAYMDREEILESINFKAIAMDPVSPVDGSPLPGMTKIRFFIHYPQGKQQEHTLQLLLFRQLGTWTNE